MGLTETTHGRNLLWLLAIGLELGQDIIHLVVIEDLGVADLARYDILPSQLLD